MPPPAGKLGPVVVLPARTRQIEQALPLLPAQRRIRIGIDENIAVIERGDEFDRLRQEHSIPEHVARHVADAGDRERLCLDVDVHFAEVAPDGFPCAARRDAHLLMVVSRRPAACESIAEPEAPAQRNLVRDVRERCRAFIGGNDKVGVVAIAADCAGWRRDLAFDDIIRQRKQA